SVAGLAAGQILVRWMSGATAGNAALAVATTVTGATHARLVHRRPLGSLLPSVPVGAPLAYVIMRAIHALLGSCGLYPTPPPGLLPLATAAAPSAHRAAGPGPAQGGTGV